jgi:hypothetical protein
MQAQAVRINLRYEPAELTEIFQYAETQDVQRGGRYDFRKPPVVNIWTHSWTTPACAEESCLMFRLEFDWKRSALMSVLLMPGFDWAGFVEELATLEKDACGQTIYGRRRHKTII